jgi:hypothetical protein
LRRCLDEASERENSLDAKLTALKALLCSTEQTLMGQHWASLVGEDILLSKINMLLDDRRLKGNSRTEEQINQRLRFEENMKKLLFAASKAKVTPG